MAGNRKDGLDSRVMELKEEIMGIPYDPKIRMASEKLHREISHISPHDLLKRLSD